MVWKEPQKSCCPSGGSQDVSGRGQWRQASSWACYFHGAEGGGDPKSRMERQPLGPGVLCPQVEGRDIFLPPSPGIMLWEDRVFMTSVPSNHRAPDPQWGSRWTTLSLSAMNFWGGGGGGKCGDWVVAAFRRVRSHMLVTAVTSPGRRWAPCSGVRTGCVRLQRLHLRSPSTLASARREAAPLSELLRPGVWVLTQSAHALGSAGTWTPRPHPQRKTTHRSGRELRTVVTPPLPWRLLLSGLG